MNPQPNPTPTRRQLLATGALGLAGLSPSNLFSDYAADHRAPAPEEQPGGPRVLQSADPRDVGMSADRLRAIDQRLQVETSRRGVTSASILVARHGKVVLHSGFGKLNSQPQAPDTRADSIYLLASISKPVSVCGLMLLVEEGKVVLSDPVLRYLPEFHGDLREKVRVQHLLSHTSGLPDMLPENIELRRAQAPLSQFVTAALGTPLLFEPGTRFAYQSMGTLLAAKIVERVAGMPLRNLLRLRIFKPLGMNCTVLGLDGLSIPETAIVRESGDSAELGRWGPNSPYWRDMGHPWGGVHSTTSDLAVLLQLFLNGGLYGPLRLFSPATTAAMTRDHNRALGSPWGLGWALRDSPVWNYFGDLGSARTFGHVGTTGTVAWADPARQLICVLLSTRPAAYQDGFLLNSISNMVQAAASPG